MGHLVCQFIERSLGLPVLESGQVSRWSWQAELPWPEQWPLAVAMVSVLGVILLVWEIYRRDAQPLAWGRRIVLVSLRLFVFAMLLVLLSQVSLSIERMGLPLVVVMVDDSASMSLRDSYRDRADQEFVSQLLESSSSVDSERWELIRRILTHDDGRWLRRMQERHRVQVERFSTDATPLLSDLRDTSDSRSLESAIQRIQPVGEGTRPAEAVRQVLQRIRGMTPAAIVLLTDGIASTGVRDQLSKVAPLAREQLVPLLVLGIGSDEPTRDVQLVELIADKTAFVNDPVVFSAKVKAFGFSGQTVTVELRERGADKILGTRNLTLPADGVLVSVDLSHTPTQAGDREYEVRIVPLAGDIDLENQRLAQVVRVREGKLKVLLAEGLPRWEFRELKNTLEREPTIELHTLLQDADLEFALQDETAKPLQGRFPATAEALKSYDVVLLGDVSPGLFAPGSLELLREFVRSGGGLLVMAGARHMPSGFRATPLEGLLPVELHQAAVSNDAIDVTNAFHPQWTTAGRQSVPMFRHMFSHASSEAEDSGKELSRSLPGLFWLSPWPRLKAGATVLLEDPERQGDRQPLPVIVWQRLGAGKVLFHATDELWRWRFRGGDRFYSQYWIQAMRFLAHSQSLNNGRGVEFTSDRQIYQRGDVVKLRLQFLDDSLTPTSAKGVVLIECPGEPSRKVELSGSPNSPQVFTGELAGLRNGRYHAIVVEPALPGSPPSLDFQLETPLRELTQRRVDRAELEAAARLSRGRYFALHEADRIPDELPTGQPVPLSAARIIPLWNRWELLLLTATGLILEWLCRRRWRLI